MAEPEVDARRQMAEKFLAAYREEHPDDARTDMQLLVGPYGGYEQADAELEHARHQEVRRARLAEAKMAHQDETKGAAPVAGPAE